MGAEKKKAFKIACQLKKLLKITNKGEIVFTLDGRQVILSFSVEDSPAPKIFLCRDEEGMSDEETA